MRICALIVILVIACGVSSVQAYSKWSGTLFMEDSSANSLTSNSDLFRSGIQLSVQPPTKKNLDARLSMQLDYTYTDSKSLFNTSPVGNLSVDVIGPNYQATLAHNRSINITTEAQLVENDSYRAGLSLLQPLWPSLNISYSHLEQKTEWTKTSDSDQFSLNSDYQFGDAGLRSGYTWQQRKSGPQGTSTTYSFLVGGGLSKEMISSLIFTADLDMNYTSSKSGASGSNTSDSTNYVYRMSFNYQPSPWYSFYSSFNWDRTDTNSSSFNSTQTTNRYLDLTGNLYPSNGVRFWTTLGNRAFDDAQADRSINSLTLGASLVRQLSEKISFNIAATHTAERDPDRGNNTRDNITLSSLLDISSRISLRWNLGVSRNEFPGFVDTTGFDASGTFADRAGYDGEVKGFTFFDTENDILYTKNSIIFADWDSGVQFVPPQQQKYSVTRTLLANLKLTDKSNMALSYSANASTDKFSPWSIDGQTLNGSLTSMPTRRISYSLTGNFSSPASGNKSVSGTFGVNYRFWRGHQFNLTYSRQKLGDLLSDHATASFRLSLRKNNSLDFTYSTADLFMKQQTHFFRVRFSHSF